ncbi:MAG: thiamine pyrophosphate-dependent dehydrogenase E1 component subunit alpha [Actinomycetota bacterium]
MARTTQGDLARLFLQMARIRHLELALGQLWQRGLISGELHLGVGEEAVAAGVVDHLVDGDALALDHRSTPPLVARGTDPTSLVLEMLGSPHGLCHGMGGHMHLFDPERLAASSGIVGSAGPLACGFALAATHLRPGKVAIAFFGEGAANQGMLMESLNLATVWKLPVVFVCKDNRLAITTRSRTVTAGRLTRRAASFGMPSSCVNGSDIGAVWRAAGKAIARARSGGGPSFILVRCRRPEGHFLGDPLLRAVREPSATSKEIGPGLVAAVREQPGAPMRERLRAAAAITAPILAAATADPFHRRDPLARARRRLGARAAARIEAKAEHEIASAVKAAMARAEMSWPA